MPLAIKQLALKWSAVTLASLALCGCLGGSIAQQIARSLLLQGADKATAAAMDAHERNEKSAAQNAPLKDTVPNDYQIAFLRSGFETIQPQVEPFPQMLYEQETPIQFMQESKLVSVEVWNLLIGDEKQSVFEKARLQGSTIIPPKEEWSQWQIAVGAAENNPSNNKQQPITFLVSPDIGKMRSGTKVIVELSSAEELSIARYALN
ncbi:MAG: hypothetical protein A3I83_06745 [Methylotenera sp. RIFCSPLOWO2_02_FULL_45_14]|nr:MAG: hypothetical protein A3I83_06745 [Methylotenera sp. RIFCSPLOWO2_02_FULL_45_14]